jgi:hypothetical protein
VHCVGVKGCVYNSQLFWQSSASLIIFLTFKFSLVIVETSFHCFQFLGVSFLRYPCLNIMFQRWFGVILYILFFSVDMFAEISL